MEPWLTFIFVINYLTFRDVAKLGESLVLPPEVPPLYLDKEFIPADTEDSGIPKVIMKFK